MRQPRQLLDPKPERALRRLLNERGTRTLLVVTADREGYRDAAEKLTSQFDGDVRTHVRVPGTEDVAAVQALEADIEKSAAEAVLSIGGGAIHDLVKAAFAAASAGDVHRAASTFEPPTTWTFPRFTIKRPLFVAVPSTFSGSEANGHAGFRCEETKRIISSEALVPDAVAIDADVLRLSPAWLLVESLFNAMNHAIEAIASPRQGALTRAASIGGAAVIGDALRDEPANWTDDQLRSLSAASVVIAAGQSGTTLGLAHAIPHVLGAHFGVRHSLAHTIACAPTLRFNGREAHSPYADLARAFGVGQVDEPAFALADALDSLARHHLGDVSLAASGVTAVDIPAMMSAVQAEPGFYSNPKPIAGLSALRGLLEDLL